MKLRMPAEWSTHRGTIMEFPVFWDNGSLREARKNYAEVANAISQFEPVTMIVNSGEEEEFARLFLNSKVTINMIAHDDAWARDNCPTFAMDEKGKLTGINWEFNAWGGKYPHWELDNIVGEKYCSQNNIECTKALLILEGGSIHTNGAGILITTSECLLNKNRNPQLSKKEIERLLMQYTGVERVVWLPFGVVEDETDGHVDNVCCFIDENTVFLYWDESDRTTANEETLKQAGLNIVKMPCPQEVNLPAASYVNFYICNGAIIMPAFGVATDKVAADIMRKVYPKREIVQINTKEILRGGGNIHCITQQIPR